MTEPTDKQLPDEQLDEYLKGDSDVSLQYRRLHSPDVTAELDNLVLRQAEAAVKPHLSGRRRPAWIRWSAPLAVAASAIVVLSIVVETGLHDETMVMHAPAPGQAKRERAQDESDASANSEPLRRAPAGAANAPGFIAPSAPAAPPPAPVYIEPKMAEPPAMEVYVPEFVDPAPASAAIQATPPAPRAPAEVDSASTADASSETRQSVSSAAAEAERQLQETSAASAERKATSGATSDSRTEEITASRRAISAEMPASPRTYTDPEAWLKDIRQLRSENKQSAADAEWRRFLTTFPNYKVADDDPAREAKK